MASGAGWANAQAASTRVRVSDINGTLLTLEQLGGSRVMEPVPLPDGGQIAHFKDPQGHLIGLMQCE